MQLVIVSRKQQKSTCHCLPWETSYLLLWMQKSSTSPTEIQNSLVCCRIHLVVIQRPSWWLVCLQPTTTMKKQSVLWGMLTEPRTLPTNQKSTKIQKMLFSENIKKKFRNLKPCLWDKFQCLRKDLKVWLQHCNLRN